MGLGRKTSPPPFIKQLFWGSRHVRCFISLLPWGFPGRGCHSEGMKPQRWSGENIAVPHPQCLQLQPQCCFSCWLLTAQASRELASWELYWSTCSLGRKPFVSPSSALQALARHLLDSSIPSNHAVLTSGLIICHPQLHPSSLSLRSLAMTQLAASFLLWFLELATQGSAIFSLSRMGRLGDGPAALCSALLRLCCCCCCLASSLHSCILFVFLVGVIFVLHLNQNVARSEAILSSCLEWVRYWSTGPRSFHVWMDYDQHPKASTVATSTGTLLGLVLKNYSIK